MSGTDTPPFTAALGWMLQLPRTAKRVAMVLADAVMFPVALWAAIFLKFDRFESATTESLPLFLVAALSPLAINPALGLYRSVVRFMGAQVMINSVVAVALSASLLALLDRTVLASRMPWSLFVIYFGVALLYVAGSRFFVRYFFSRMRSQRVQSRVAIYGAGDAGARLAALLLADDVYQPVAFIDDKRGLQGSIINGIKVFSSAMLPELIREHRIDRILLAIPSASHRRRRQILATMEPLAVHVQLLPDLSEIIAGRARIDDLRDVDVNDLLGRDPVPPDSGLLQSCIKGKSVLVTGAGGSIGSELCRQILRVAPKRLVLFEMSELALYTIEKELLELSKRNGFTAEIVPLLGNAHHRHRIRDVFASYGVQTVYHAAAYKHVPIVEHNVVEGIHNNVISTWYTAQAATETGVEVFVLISTDKAVNPANVMGATKRMSELVLQALQQRSSITKFCMVRFGNVLASSGSVVPLFREQIRAGGPVTVTHREVIRYFMTIPEAAQLVIQAGSMAEGGDVFVLDMGRPVRIDDLARRMINLMGFSVRDAANPDGDIEIKYTGLRTAEKLFEELLIGSDVTGTDHPMIMRAMEHSLSWDKMQHVLDEMLVALGSYDCRRALSLLSDAVAEYNVSADIRDYVWLRKSRETSVDERKVTEFVPKRRLSEGTAPRI